MSTGEIRKWKSNKTNCVNEKKFFWLSQDFCSSSSRSAPPCWWPPCPPQASCGPTCHSSWCQHPGWWYGSPHWSENQKWRLYIYQTWLYISINISLRPAYFISKHSKYWFQLFHFALHVWAAFDHRNAISQISKDAKLLYGEVFATSDWQFSFWMEWRNVSGKAALLRLNSNLFCISNQGTQQHLSKYSTAIYQQCIKRWDEFV